jgi:hypothetical protein
LPLGIGSINSGRTLHAMAAHPVFTALVGIMNDACGGFPGTAVKRLVVNRAGEFALFGVSNAGHYAEDGSR